MESCPAAGRSVQLNEIGVLCTTGLPTERSRTTGSIRAAPPLHCEHTDGVLRDAGLAPEEIALLRERAIVA